MTNIIISIIFLVIFTYELILFQYYLFISCAKIDISHFIVTRKVFLNLF